MAKTSIQLKPITQFSSFDSYFRSTLDTFRATTAHFSFEKFCRDAGFKSKSVVTMYAQAKRTPSAENLAKLGEYLQWTREDLEFASLLIARTKTIGATENQNFYTKQLQRLQTKPINAKLIQDYSAMLIIWYTGTIHEMFQLKNFQASTAWIAERLGGQITQEAVQTALQDLERLGLIAKDEKMGWRLLESSWSTPVEFPSKLIRSFHRTMLNRARAALERESISTRFNMAQTLSVQEKDLPEAKKFLDEILDEFTKRFFSSQGYQVYHCAIQLFPLTKNEGV